MVSEATVPSWMTREEDDTTHLGGAEEIIPIHQWDNSSEKTKQRFQKIKEIEREKKPEYFSAVVTLPEDLQYKAIHRKDIARLEERIQFLQTKDGRLGHIASEIATLTRVVDFLLGNPHVYIKPRTKQKESA